MEHFLHLDTHYALKAIHLPILIYQLTSISYFRFFPEAMRDIPFHNSPIDSLQPNNVQVLPMNSQFSW